MQFSTIFTVSTFALSVLSLPAPEIVTETEYHTVTVSGSSSSSTGSIPNGIPTGEFNSTNGYNSTQPGLNSTVSLSNGTSNGTADAQSTAYKLI
ncbi:putative secreted protein [Wickerhamomyces ciferrii]|uniref:Secreted protein n=1 Tax=Wickerhamomyces ciferrii (strain ATCC 14091 / BCRC 22168 / CBS 111 / JCM 3599 / NBRC 0793 / NRRL Y-1031 F-60-10) TaxID=1206466 RepID=K0KJ70_WICCF|nr:uncharacterized protein BN7_4842 [Wickerhamomyces ciferrii]CCH45260.1 putative secreted protein [Wickerhamomyces ciferrii]